MTVIARLIGDPAMLVLSLLLGIGVAAMIERRTRPRHRASTPPYASDGGAEFDEVNVPVVAGCSSPLGCLCYSRGMRSHAERAGCVFRTERRTVTESTWRPPGSADRYYVMLLEAQRPEITGVWVDEFYDLTPEQAQTVERAFAGKLRDADFIEFRADKDKP